MSDNAKANAQASKLLAALDKLGGPQKAVLQKLIGQTAVAQAQMGVRRSQTPYGERFAALTSRVGIPLRRTGNNIQRSFTSGQETPTTFIFGSRFKYFATHQYGAKITAKRSKYLRFKTEKGWRIAKAVTIPRRQMVPEMDTGGLGNTWEGAFARTAKSYLKRLMAGTQAKVA